jgi:hypothetical protein
VERTGHERHAKSTVLDGPPFTTTLRATAHGGRMEKLRGIVSKVDSSVIEYPADNRHAKTRTTYISSFQINGRKIKYESTTQHKFYEGNHMIVAGITQRGILNALACKDLTTGNEVSEGCFLMFLGGVAFMVPVIGLLSMVFLTMTAAEATVGAIIGIGLFVGGFLFFSALLLYSGVRTLQAINAVRQEAP